MKDTIQIPAAFRFLKNRNILITEPPANCANPAQFAMDSWRTALTDDAPVSAQFETEGPLVLIYTSGSGNTRVEVNFRVKRAVVVTTARNRAELAAAKRGEFFDKWAQTFARRMPTRHPVVDE